jgi:DNA repair exonuclease SbcCD nuclease subunit
MKLLFIGDVHLADSSPSKRDGQYRNDIFKKLEECVSIAVENKVDCVVFAGDLFHHKDGSKTKHKTVRQLFELLESFVVPVYICVGNHDITSGRLESIENQPLGVIAKAKNVTLMPSPIHEFNTEAGQLPFIAQGNTSFCSIPGVPGVEVKDYKISTSGAARWNVLVAHQSIVPDKSKLPPFLRDKDFMHDSAEVAAVCDYDVILYGHEHGNHGVYNRSRGGDSKTLFVNVGSICRGTIGEDDLKKEPSVFVLSLEDKLAGKVVKLKSVRPIEECFLLEEHFTNVERNKDIEEAIRRLKDTRLERFSVESIISNIERRGDVDDEVRSTALELLETVK